jgi:hypothetical protein
VNEPLCGAYSFALGLDANYITSMHSSFKHKTKQQIQYNQVGGISELKTWNKQNQLNPDIIFPYMATDVEQEKPTERILTI